MISHSGIVPAEDPCTQGGASPLFSGQSGTSSRPTRSLSNSKGSNLAPRAVSPRAVAPSGACQPLPPRRCAWPSDGACPERALLRSSYCPAHHALAHQPSRRRKLVHTPAPESPAS
jgi:hypothetical protein